METSVTTAYEEVLRGLVGALGANWKVTTQRRSGFACCMVESLRRPLPAQGWKIHVSTSGTEAADVCLRLVPRLIAREASFKVAADLSSILLLNSGKVGRTQTGKVFTVYPADEAEAVSLAKELDALCPSTAGPAIPSDLVLRRGGAVHLRYGAFLGRTVVDYLGRHVSVVSTPEGELVADHRADDGDQPDWVKPPFEGLRSALPDPRGPFRIDDKNYLPLALLYRSPRGRVYLAVTVPDAQEAILKVAHRGVGGDPEGRESIRRLETEYRALVDLGAFPDIAPMGFGFCGGDPAVLAMEFVEGHSLENAAPDERLPSLPLLAEAIGRVHAAGYVHGDVKPGNALITVDGVRLIDFELARRIGESTVSPAAGTRGYVAPEKAARAQTSTDLYALGVCIAQVVIDGDPSAMPATTKRLLGILPLMRRDAISDVARMLMHADPEQRPDAFTAASLLREALREKAPRSRVSRRREPIQWCWRAAHEAGNATRAFRQSEGNGFWWISAHQNFEGPSEGLNVGAAGVVIGLASLDHASRQRRFDDDIRGGAEWLAARAPASHAHGMFSGNAGVAVALALASRRFSRADWMRAARLRLEAAATGVDANFDLFSGRAGILFCAFLIADILDERWPLDVAAESAEALMRHVTTIDGVRVWPNSDIGSEEWLTGPMRGQPTAARSHEASATAALPLRVFNGVTALPVICGAFCSASETTHCLRMRSTGRRRRCCSAMRLAAASTVTASLASSNCGAWRLRLYRVFPILHGTARNAPSLF